MAEATAGIIAFTDDDVLVDRWWLKGIATGFARDARAGCVTGLVSPIALDNPSQQYFDRRFGWGARTDPRVFSLADPDGLSSLHPYSAGIFGTGANFAVDRGLLEALGGFDEALGAGSPAGGGEELDVFVQTLRADRTVVYAPSAVVWHTHRADPRALRRQLFYYGVGLTAFLSKYLVDARTGGEILARLPQGARQMWRLWSPIVAGGRRPAALVATETARLRRNCHRLVWLNPLAGTPGYQPLAGGMRAAYPYIDDFLPAGTVASLERLGEILGGVRAGDTRRGSEAAAHAALPGNVGPVVGGPPLVVGGETIERTAARPLR